MEMMEESGAEKTATVFGGTGFLGRHIAEALYSSGYRVRVAARRPKRARPPSGAAVGRFDAISADIRSSVSIDDALSGASVAVNAVSLFDETKNVSFAEIHEEGAERLAARAAGSGVERLLHISGIGADPASPHKYIRSRGIGEERVRKAFPKVTILRPGIMFGPGDAFYSALASMLRVALVFPLIGGGRTRLQPVYVVDVVGAGCRAIADDRTAGKTFELGADRVYTLREAVEYTRGLLGVRRALVPLPFAMATCLAAVSERLPGAPLTRNQVDLLRHDNVVTGGFPGFKDLEITPRAVEEIVPRYVGDRKRAETAERRITD